MSKKSKKLVPMTVEDLIVAKHGQWIQVSHDNFTCVPQTKELQ